MGSNTYKLSGGSPSQKCHGKRQQGRQCWGFPSSYQSRDIRGGRTGLNSDYYRRRLRGRIICILGVHHVQLLHRSRRPVSALCFLLCRYASLQRDTTCYLCHYTSLLTLDVQAGSDAFCFVSYWAHWKHSPCTSWQSSQSATRQPHTASWSAKHSAGSCQPVSTSTCCHIMLDRAAMTPCCDA